VQLQDEDAVLIKIYDSKLRNKPKEGAKKKKTLTVDRHQWRQTTLQLVALQLLSEMQRTLEFLISRKKDLLYFIWKHVHVPTMGPTQTCIRRHRRFSSFPLRKLREQ
jgi:hypothetical protein